MTQVYDRKLQEILKKTAAEQKIALQEGVYAQLTGPSYETPAEVELLRRLRRRCSRHVDCGGSGRSKPYGNAYLRNFVYQQPGSGHDKTAAQP